jgi:hypothetical protein
MAGRRPNIRYDLETRELAWRCHAHDFESAYDAVGEALDVELSGYRLYCSTIRGKPGTGRRVSLSLFFWCKDRRVAATPDEARKALELVAQVAQSPVEDAVEEDLPAHHN